MKVEFKETYSCKAISQQLQFTLESHRFHLSTASSACAPKIVSVET